jgi:hypothetical protein
MPLVLNVRHAVQQFRCTQLADSVTANAQCLVYVVPGLLVHFLCSVSAAERRADTAFMCRCPSVAIRRIGPEIIGKVAGRSEGKIEVYARLVRWRVVCTRFAAARVEA